MKYPNIPTSQPDTGYDYGKETNEKLLDLKWTPAQYDMFLDYLHNTMPISDMAGLLLQFAPVDWIQSEADVIGVFDGDDNDRP